MPKLMPTFHNIPPSIQVLVKEAVRSLSPQEIILFGSRARGDARDNSDFDLAFKLGSVGKHAWTKFVVEVEEKPLTLYKVDLVDIDGLSAEYLANIKKEGLTLYG